MPATSRGVYHNLKESKHTISNSEVVFFFSSEFTLNKFMRRYHKDRKMFAKNVMKITDTSLNFDMLSDIDTYRKCEKRGFYAWVNGLSVTLEFLELYALRKMSEEESLEWKQIERPKLNERFSVR